MEGDEKIAIREYQKYKRQLPDYKYLHQYWVINFTYTSINYDDLKKYVDELTKYHKVFKKATNARNYHYHKFIENIKKEEPGHRSWRIGMNNILDDMTQKLEYWKYILDKKFNTIIKEQQFTYKPDIDIEDTIDDDNYDAIKDEKNRKNIAYPPRLTKSQKNKKRKIISKLREKQKMQNERERQLLESNVIMDLDNLDKLLEFKDFMKKLFFDDNISLDQVNIYKYTMILSTLESWINTNNINNKTLLSFIRKHIYEYLDSKTEEKEYWKLDSNYFILVALSNDKYTRKYVLDEISKIPYSKWDKYTAGLLCLYKYQDVKSYPFKFRKYYLKHDHYIYLQYIHIILTILKIKEKERNILMDIMKMKNKEERVKEFYKLDIYTKKREDLDDYSYFISCINGYNIQYMYTQKYLYLRDITTWPQNEKNTLERLMKRIYDILKNGSYTHYFDKKFHHKQT